MTPDDLDKQTLIALKQCGAGVSETFKE